MENTVRGPPRTLRSARARRVYVHSVPGALTRVPSRAQHSLWLGVEVRADRQQLRARHGHGRGRRGDRHGALQIVRRDSIDLAGSADVEAAQMPRD
jgi:hypothetical protein